MFVNITSRTKKKTNKQKKKKKLPNKQTNEAKFKKIGKSKNYFSNY